MEENILLSIFVLMPLLIAFSAYNFFKKIVPRFKKYKFPKLVIGNLLCFLLLCSLIILGAEVYYRFIYDTTDSFGLTKVAKKWHMRHYKYNNYNVRDSVDYNPKLSGKRRITFFGDSFTAGHGINNVENRFANKIRKLRPEFEIHVMAGNGWDTAKQLGTMVELAQNGYEFDNVVLVYVLNDISDLVPEWSKILDRIYSIKPAFLFEYSYFFNILYFRSYSKIDPDVANYYGFVNDAYNSEIWDRQKQLLTSIKDGMDARGIKFSVIIFPFMHDIGEDYKYEEVHEKIDNFWKSLNVPYLDLLTVYKSYSSKQLVVNKNDAHPNKFAHSLASKAIDKFLHQSLVASPNISQK